MKIFPLMASFLAGFVVASLIGLFFIVPGLRTLWTMDVQSDYCVPLKIIHEEILSTAQEEGCEKTVAQLRVLNQRFDYYHAEGPTPHDWWDEIIAAKQPATRPATQAATP